MTREELLMRLAECARNPDREVAHIEADEAVLEYVGDADVTAAFDAFEKWYA